MPEARNDAHPSRNGTVSDAEASRRGIERVSTTMSQDWLSHHRESYSGWTEQAFPGQRDEPARATNNSKFQDDPMDDDASLSSLQRAGLWGLGIAAVAWIALVAANGADPEIANNWAWLVNLIAVAAAPLIVLGGLALFITRGRGAPFLRITPVDAEQITAEARQAMSLLADVNAQLAAQSREAAQMASRSTDSVLQSIASMTDHANQLEQGSASTLARVNAVGDRIAAMSDTLPRLEDRLATLGETLARLGGDLGQRHESLDQQLQTTALVAEEARLQLTDASKTLETRLASLRDGTQQTGEELANLAELSSARLDLTIERVKTLLDSTDQRLSSQNEALATLVEQSRTAIDQTSDHGLERFTSNCQAIAGQLEELEARLAGQSQRSDQWLTETARKAAALAQAFETLEQAAQARTNRLSETVAVLSSNTQALSDALTNGGASAEQLTSRAEALLVALDSGIRELDESYPNSISRVETQLSVVQDHIRSAAPALESVEAVARGLANQLRESDKATTGQLTALTEALLTSKETLDQQKEQVTALANAVRQAVQGLSELEQSIGPRLVSTMDDVQDKASTAAARAREAINRVIPSAADELAKASGIAVRQALAGSITAEIERLSSFADVAVDAAQRATQKLTSDMLTLTEVSKDLDLKLTAATERLEAQDRDLVSERSAMLIKALDEHAIDVSKWFEKDISDSDWNAYLKGDQGLFARRATKLLAGNEAKQVHSLYRDDAEFREHVNRYIRDFESLLRTVMGAKDGSTLALTMISSDIGKLYVALAQAIERLRPN
jgi:hypothetical protein